MKDFFSIEGPFATGANLIGDWIIISILWLVCSIPLFTAGAAATAAYYVTVKSVREHRGHVVKEFFRCFRENFKPSVLFSLGYVLLIVVILMDCLFFVMNRQVFQTSIYFYLLLFAALFLLSNAAFLFPCLSRYILKKKELWKLSVILQCKHIFVTLLFLILLSVGVFFIITQPWSILILPGLNIYLYSFAMERLLVRYAPKSQS